MAARRNSFYDVLTAAVSDIADHGFDSADRIDTWLRRLREAAESALTPSVKLREMLNDALRAIYRRLVEQGKIADYHPGIGRFAVEKLAPHMRAELSRRIMASADLIKLNREQAIANTMRRFSGWATSVPAGGGATGNKTEVKTGIRKALAQLPFEERRVMIDQGYKLTAALNDVIAKDQNAIAAIWHSHWRQSGYNFREDHKELDKQVFAVRGNWAIERGLMNGGDGYTDDIEAPAFLPFCRCWYQYVYALRDLPGAMLTAKGRAELKQVRIVA